MIYQALTLYRCTVALSRSKTILNELPLSWVSSLRGAHGGRTQPYRTTISNRSQSRFYQTNYLELENICVIKTELGLSKGGVASCK